MLRKFWFKLSSKVGSQYLEVWCFLLGCGVGRGSKGDTTSFLTQLRGREKGHYHTDSQKGDNRATFTLTSSSHEITNPNATCCNRGISFEEVMPKFGHEAFPCEGSKRGISGLSMSIWGGLQLHKLAVGQRMLAQLISTCCLQWPFNQQAGRERDDGISGFMPERALLIINISYVLFRNHSSCWRNTAM